MSIKYTKERNLFDYDKELEIKTEFSIDNIATLYFGDCLDFLKQIPDQSIQLIVTSPPYNIGKKYEKKYSHLNGEEYLMVHHKNIYDEIINIIRAVNAGTFRTTQG